MTETVKRYKKGATALVVVLCVFAGMGLLHFFGVFTFLEYKAYDLRVNVFASSSRPSDSIIVVLLDQESIDWAGAQRGWPWPWPRKAYAEMVDYMNAGGAQAVAFDVLFSEPSVYRSADQDEIIDTAVGKMEEMRANFTAAGEQPRSAARGRGAEAGTAASRPAAGDDAGRQGGFGIEGYREAMEALRGLSARADDDSFIEAEKKFGRVVQAAFFSTVSGNAKSWPANLNAPVFSLSGFEEFIPRYAALSGQGEQAEVWAQLPLEDLRNAAGALGSVTGWPDSDGILRRTSLFTWYDGKAVPSLAAAALLVSGADSALSYDSKQQVIRWGDYSIPVDSDGRSILRFRGGLERYVPYPAHLILRSAEMYANGEEPFLPPGDFAGKYVFFGFYAPGLYDIFANPISSVYPGVGMHITMLDNILSRDFIREIPLAADFAFLFGVIVVIVLLSLFSGRLPLSIGGMGVIIAGILALSFAAYSGGFWFPMVLPLAGALAAFLTCMIYNYATEGSQRRFIKNAFNHYLSPIYVDQLAANPDKLTLGGERREISILFSDVQGFTTISEKLDPDQLKELLNEYLTFLTNIIQNSGGTIDKYEGDAIIAFWNAPLDIENHAARALDAALECQKQLAEKGPYFEEKFKNWNIDSPKINKRLLTRIGLNTGYAVVGNFGSEKHFNYTMLGDSVNLAARLEGLNKQFGTFIMCTDNTFTKAGGCHAFYGRKLAQVAVVGKSEPVTVWEPLTEPVYREKERVIRAFDEARDIFYTGDFARALSLFEALKDKDSPPAFYAEQCRFYLQSPESWKGFWQALSK
ncbi:MAG: adenylate/guanylate cyclase domain-containing protein [Treponema sp.]|jgi:class 3 adenylate cyclase/CHASE2 domain-containing sensor protein|nr:adenylate/guanylate cyclase domain-containing protein [Treponema sp.]